MTCQTCRLTTEHEHKARRVVVRQDIMARLESRSRELEDYIQASKLMREIQAEMIAASMAGSRYADGWLDAFRQWNEMLLRIMATGSRREQEQQDAEAETQFLRPIR